MIPIIIYNKGVCGVADIVSSGISVFNNTIGLTAFGIAFSAAGSAFCWLGRKANYIAHAADLPVSGVYIKFSLNISLNSHYLEK